MTLVSVSWAAMAQTRTVSGTVVDAGNNEPLVGATVMPIGGGQGTATDIDGRFTLTVPTNVKSAKVSYVGYKEQTVALHDKMTVHLANSSTNLDDVVVVAYGTANKESLTGSVAVVGANEIADRPVTSVTTALEGSAPGVNVNSSTGYPGSAPQIRIRGFNSFNSGAQDPLYVVDGMVYDGSIAELNPADVESMSVLKDAASCALYGSRGANGVVLITTKRAKGQGKVDVNLQMNWGAYQLALPLFDRLGVNDWMETAARGWVAGLASSQGISYEDAYNQNATNFISSQLKGLNIFDKDATEVFDAEGKLVANVLPGYNDLDWWKAMTRTGFREDYTINASGATEKFNVFASIGYLNQKGYVIESDYKRFTGRFNATFTPNSYFRAGLNMSGSYVKSSDANVDENSMNSTDNPFITMFTAPVLPIYAHNEDGSIIMKENGEPRFGTYDMNQNNNVVWSTYADKIKSSSLNLDGSIYGTAIIPYGFELTVKAGMYRYKTTSDQYSSNEIGSQRGIGGLDDIFTDFRSYTFTQQLNWAHEYGLNHVDVLLLHENYLMGYDQKFFRLSGQKLDGMYILSNFNDCDAWNEGANSYGTESYLGRARYNYDQRYFGEFSINRDGTSQFHKDHRWGTFWSVGASWIISKEKFMQNLHWVNYLKLRAAYGTTGNNQACGYYNYLNLYAYDPSGNLVPDQIGNPDLKWEATKTLDVALEGSLFNDRFNFSIGYFDKRNSDLIYSLRRPYSVGTMFNFGSLPTVLTNIGEMENYGWELQFGVDIIRNANLIWDFNIDASFIKNQINKLPDGHDMPGSGLFIGKSLYEKYTYEYAGVDQMTGRSLYVMNPESPDFYNYNDDGTVTYDQETWDSYLAAAKADGTYVNINGVDYTYSTQHAGRKVMGSALPKVYGSFGTNLSWKGLRFGLLFTYALGGKVSNSNYASLASYTSTSAIHKDVLNAWTHAPEGMTADSPNRIDPDGFPVWNSYYATENDASSSRWLISGNYLSLKNLNLSYDLPQKWVSALKLQNINLGFQMENVFIATKMKGLNPEAAIGGAQGSGGAYFQPARTYTFQIGVKF